MRESFTRILINNFYVPICLVVAAIIIGIIAYLIIRRKRDVNEQDGLKSRLQNIDRRNSDIEDELERLELRIKKLEGKNKRE